MKYLILTIYLLSAFFSQMSAATNWQSEPAESELVYAVNFEQLPINGQFKEFSVDYIAGQQLRVVVNIASVDMGNSDINQAIRDVDWFDIKHHSQAVFFSDNINAINETDFIAEGQLQLKGISKPVSVPFSWQPTAQPENPGEPADSASMTGKLILNRSDFAIGSAEWASGDQIGIDVDVRFAVKMLKHATE